MISELDNLRSQVSYLQQQLAESRKELALVEAVIVRCETGIEKGVRTTHDWLAQVLLWFSLQTGKPSPLDDIDDVED